MITKRERNKIKKELGGHYSELVIEQLHKAGIRNRHGMPHSHSMIRNVMNGQAHSEIEKAIYDAIEAKQLKDKEINLRRERLLKKQKTEVGASV